MKIALKIIITLAVGFTLVTLIISCALTNSSLKSSGFLGDYANNLHPGPEGGAKELWLKLGVDGSKYNKFILEHVIFFFADDSQYKGIDSLELHQLAEHFDLAIINALKGSYPIVTEPGPDVLRLRIAITDLKQSMPAVGVVSTVAMATPIGLGLNLIKKGATSSWSGSGGIKAEFLVFDSMTNQVIVAGRDQRHAGFTERYTKWGTAEEAFKHWSERIKTLMDRFHGIQK